MTALITIAVTLPAAVASGIAWVAVRTHRRALPPDVVEFRRRLRETPFPAEEGAS